MFDIGATELLVIAVVAILVIGPKDLPLALRTAGRWIGKIRRVSAHFRTGLDAMVREAEIEEMDEKWRKRNEEIMARYPSGDEMTPLPEPAPEEASGNLSAAEAKVAQAREDTARKIAALEVERASKTRQLEQARALAANSTKTFNTYVTAHREGQRTVREVVTLLEAQVSAARRAAGLRFDVIRTEIDLAALRGTLVDGETL